jgi:hypothetical protein
MALLPFNRRSDPTPTYTPFPANRLKFHDVPRNASELLAYAFRRKRDPGQARDERRLHAVDALRFERLLRGLSDPVAGAVALPSSA